jgi:hypothetical protein
LCHPFSFDDDGRGDWWAGGVEEESCDCVVVDVIAARMNLSFANSYS